MAAMGMAMKSRRGNASNFQDSCTLSLIQLEEVPLMGRGSLNVGVEILEDFVVI
jgi:hypothetical protein